MFALNVTGGKIVAVPVPQLVPVPVTIETVVAVAFVLLKENASTRGTVEPLAATICVVAAAMPVKID